jgi:glutathione-independent formaldehyde dehydrogenase
MRAIVYRKPNQVVVEDVPDPTIEAPTDVIVRVTSAGICGSDLHMYEGRSPSEGDMRFGRSPPSRWAIAW